MDENNVKEEVKTAWYVVNTYAGHERNVRDNLLTRIKNDGLQDLIFRIEIAEEEEEEVKNGKRIKKIKNLFPGYMFVQMKMTDEIWYIVRNTNGVTGFIGSSGGGAKPFSVPEDEIESILRRIGKSDAKIVVQFTVGDRVRILNGPFANVEGIVDSMDDNAQIATVLAIMFGRETPTEVGYVDLEKVED